MEPKIILFDEPLSNLDARLRLRMREEIRSLQQRLSLTAIFVTHDQSEALTMSDTIVVMSAGRIEQVGTPAEIYHRPANRFVAGFLGTSNFIEGTVSEVLHEDAHYGRYRISTTLGDIECDGVPGLEEAQSTAIVIRAEDLVVGEERSDSLRIPGTIVSSAFDGDVINYVVDTPCGRLQGRAPGTADVRATGHETDCAVDSALMWAVPQEQEGA